MLFIIKVNKAGKLLFRTSRSDDITREIDLIEEIGRLYGFNNFVTRLPKINYDW
jgi:phenylalanyl-tRNA synthetase beta subunit